MNRSRTVMIPQSAAFGMPISASPIPIDSPQLMLTMSWDSKQRLIRWAASFIASVVRCKSCLPASRSNRSRRSSRSSKIMMTKTMTNPPAANGCSNGPMMLWTTCNGPGLGSESERVPALSPECRRLQWRKAHSLPRPGFPRCHGARHFGADAAASVSPSFGGLPGIWKMVNRSI